MKWSLKTKTSTLTNFTRNKTVLEILKYPQSLMKKIDPLAEFLEDLLEDKEDSATSNRRRKDSCNFLQTHNPTCFSSNLQLLN